MDVNLKEYQLIRQAARGDQVAYAHLVLRYQYPLRHIIHRYIDDPSEVADVLQETLFHCYRALPNFHFDSSFYTWLYRIAVNTAKNQLRRDKKARFMTLEREVFNNDSPEELASTDEMQETLMTVLRHMPANLRLPLLLQTVHGLSYDDIASQLHCPVGTVRSRLARAKSELHHEIRQFIE